MRPLIAVTANIDPPDDDRAFYIGKTLEYAERGLLEYVQRAGGLPIIVPASVGLEDALRYLAPCHGLLLSGGADVAPGGYGETPRRPQWAGQPERDAVEYALLEAALRRDMPVLGVCRGHQIANVHRGGSMYQDLIEDGVATDLHRDPIVYDKLHHDATIEPRTYLAELYGAGPVRINSVHHQAVREPGAGLAVAARSPEGLIEATWDASRRFFVTVQWHPEWIDDDDEAAGVLSGRPLAQAFCDAAAAFALLPST